MTKMVFILTTYEVGGASTVAKNLLDIWTGGRFDITLVVEKLSERHYPIDDRIKTIDLGVTPRKDPLSKIINILRHIAAMRKAIMAESPSAVISFGTHANCVALVALALWPYKRQKLRLIISEHTEEIFLNNKRNMRDMIFRMLYRLFMFLFYHKADYIVAVSKSIERHVKKLLFVSSRQVKVIYNPIDIKKIKNLYPQKDSLEKFKGPSPCIGTISRLSTEKGVSFLVEGFKALSEKSDGRLLIVGDGPERSRLEGMAGLLGLNGRVIFTGWVDDPFKYLAKMDIFVLPSFLEGFPNVILEAMACGVPVIASDSVGGIREAIKHGVNGILIKPGSSKEIAAAAYDLLLDTEKRRAITQEAYRGVKRYDIDEIKPQYEALIYS